MQNINFYEDGYAIAVQAYRAIRHMNFAGKYIFGRTTNLSCPTFQNESAQKGPALDSSGGDSDIFTLLPTLPVICDRRPS